MGAGSVARRHAETLLREVGGVGVVGVTDVTPDAAASFGRDMGAAVYADAHALLDGAAPDAVYVCVPPFAHGEPERALIERGVPFFVEKPLAADLATAEALAAAVAERGLVTATGYHWRYLDGVERARALLAETPARLAVGAWLDTVPPPAWWVRQEASGGQVVEQTTHVLDVMVDLLGDVEHVYALAARTERPDFPEADVDDVSSGILRFASGAVGSVASTCLLPGKHRAGLEFFCDGRRLELTETELVVDDGDGPVRHADPGEAKRRVDADFVAAVRGEQNAVRAPYPVALRTHRVACALAESARARRPLDLPAAA